MRKNLCPCLRSENPCPNHLSQCNLHLVPGHCPPLQLPQNLNSSIASPTPTFTTDNTSIRCSASYHRLLRFSTKCKHEQVSGHLISTLSLSAVSDKRRRHRLLRHHPLTPWLLLSRVPPPTGLFLFGPLILLTGTDEPRTNAAEAALSPPQEVPAPRIPAPPSSEPLATPRKLMDIHP